MEIPWIGPIASFLKYLYLFARHRPNVECILYMVVDEGAEGEEYQGKKLVFEWVIVHLKLVNRGYAATTVQDLYISALSNGHECYRLTPARSVKVGGKEIEYTFPVGVVLPSNGMYHEYVRFVGERKELHGMRVTGHLLIIELVNHKTISVSLGGES